MTINEVSYLNYYKNGTLLGSNSWESFINYKLLNGKWDCDRSVEAKKALEMIYGESTYTDTLISPQSYVTLYMRYFHSDMLKYDESKNKHIVPNIGGLKKQMINTGMTNISNSAIWSYFLKNNNIKVHDFMLEFLHSAYTLPNFSCVCRGFNMGRTAKTGDNFLIALYHIRNYFENRNRNVPDSQLRRILAKFLSANVIYKNGKREILLTQADVIYEAQKWLSKFPSFSEFIKAYSFQHFLEDPTEFNSKPKELWKGMFEGKLQPSNAEFQDTIESWTKIIKARGGIG